MKVRKITRKTPCDSCKPRIKRNEMVYTHCNACGEWEVANGKATRPVGWKGNYSRIQ